MDVCPDVWGQLALEASQVYLTDGTAARSPFAGTVMHMELKILNVNTEPVYIAYKFSIGILVGF